MTYSERGRRMEFIDGQFQNTAASVFDPQQQQDVHRDRVWFNG
jgi:hypothetical protein